MKIQLESLSKKSFILFITFMFSLLSVNAESLWMSGERELSDYEDDNALHVGDVITIVVTEKITLASATGNTTTRKSSVANSITQFLYANSGFGKHKGTLPATTAAADRKFENSGTLSNSAELSDIKIGVVITDVLPNGNFVIEGVRLVSFSGESYRTILRGVVRKQDLGRDTDGTYNRNFVNMVQSQYLADTQVEVISKGNLSDAQKPGWGLRVLDAIWPF